MICLQLNNNEFCNRKTQQLNTNNKNYKHGKQNDWNWSSVPKI